MHFDSFEHEWGDVEAQRAPQRRVEHYWPFDPIEEAGRGPSLSLTLGWRACANPLMSSRVNWKQFVEWMAPYSPCDPEDPVTWFPLRYDRLEPARGAQPLEVTCLVGRVVLEVLLAQRGWERRVCGGQEKVLWAPDARQPQGYLIVPLAQPVPFAQARAFHQAARSWSGPTRWIDWGRWPQWPTGWWSESEEPVTSYGFWKPGDWLEPEDVWAAAAVR